MTGAGWFSSLELQAPAGSLRRLGEILVLLAVLVSWTGFAGELVSALAASSTLNYGEPFVLNAALNLDRLYRRIAEYPYLVNNYPPLYPALVGLAHLLIPDIFAAGRVVSASALLLAAALCYAAGRISGSRRAFALLGASLFALSPVAHWGLIARVDCLALAFSVSAVVKILHDRSARSASWAGLLTVAALFTKQSMLAAPLAITCYLATVGERRSFFRYLATVVGGGSTAFAMLLWLSGGTAWEHLVVANANTFHLDLLTSSYGQFALRHVVIVGGATIATLLLRSEVRLLKYYFFASVLVAMSAAKIGSDLNYFLPMLWASACLTGIYVGHARETWSQGGAWPFRSMWYGSVMLLMALQIWMFRGGSAVPSENWSHVREFLEGREGMLLSEDAGFSLSLDREVWYQPFVLKQLFEERAPIGGRKNPVLWVESALWRGTIPTVVILPDKIPEQRWTREQLTALDRCYRPVLEADPYLVLASSDRCRTFEFGSVQ